MNQKNDECYTRKLENGYRNLITTDDDFYKLANNIEYDIIISNLPFHNSSKLFTKLLELNKPFILLQPIMFFNNGTCIKMLIEYGANFGALCPNKRMGFHIFI